MRGPVARRAGPPRPPAGSTTWPSASTTGPGPVAGAGHRPARRARQRRAGVRQSSRRGSGWRKSAAGVAAGHGAQLVVGERAPGLGQHALGVGPRRVGVGVVALHHDVVDADDVALRHGGRVVDGAEPEVAPQHLARQQVGRPGVALGARRRVPEHVVGPVHQHGHPADAALGQGDVQSGEAQRHARPQPLAGGEQRVDREDGGQQLERRVGRGERRPGRRAGVQAHHGAGLLAGGEEGVPRAR